MASVAEPSPQPFNWGKERADLLRDSNTRTSTKHKLRYVNMTKNHESGLGTKSKALRVMSSPSVRWMILSRSQAKFGFALLSQV